MSIEIPKGINLDERIIPRFNLKMDAARLRQLQENDKFIYPVEFGIFDQISPLLADDESDFISPSRFEPKELDGSVITFTVMTARMFDWGIIINRGDFLFSDTLRKINYHLKKGKVSLCHFYDALLLWDQRRLVWDSFDSTDTDNDYRWIGVEPFTTRHLRYGIFQLHKDVSGKIRLLMGDMSSQTTFCSRCPIILRYESTC